MKDANFYKKNLIRLKELALDCPECIQARLMCHHYDYLRDYIKELEFIPPLDSELFENFWKSYPRKQAKVYARKVWQRLKVDEELFNSIMEALKVHKKLEQWKRDGGQFIPHASTWLNQRRWEDEFIQPPSGGGQPIRVFVAQQEAPLTQEQRENREKLLQQIREKLPQH